MLIIFYGEGNLLKKSVHPLSSKLSIYSYKMLKSVNLELEDQKFHCLYFTKISPSKLQLQYLILADFDYKVQLCNLSGGSSLVRKKGRKKGSQPRSLMQLIAVLSSNTVNPIDLIG